MIGTATMEEDGTLVLNLRATGAGGVVGDGQIRYQPGSPHYASVLAHVGPMKPGEVRPVRAFES